MSYPVCAACKQTYWPMVDENYCSAECAKAEEVPDYVPTECLPESHPHECFGEYCRKAGTTFGSQWLHEDADCRYPLKYDCPICDKAPTDWVKVSEEHWPIEVRR